DFLLIAHREIVVAPGPDIVPLSKERDDLLLRCGNLPAVANLDIDVAQRRPANHPLHRAGKRHDHDIVLIDALRAQTLRSQNSSNGEWNILNPQNLSDRIVVTVNLRRGCSTDHTDLIGAAHILSSKRRTVHQWPLTNVEII